MRRRIVNLLTLGSLLACLAVAALWVRTCWRCDQVGLPGHTLVVFTQPHAVWLAASHPPYWTAPAYESRPADGAFGRQFEWVQLRGRRTADGTVYALGCFAYFASRLSVKPFTRFDYVGVPLWFPLVLTAALPAAWLVRRRRLPGAGHCGRCGYDLRATPERCPECGAVAATRSTP